MQRVRQDYIWMCNTSSGVWNEIEQINLSLLPGVSRNRGLGSKRPLSGVCVDISRNVSDWFVSLHVLRSPDMWIQPYCGPVLCSTLNIYITIWWQIRCHSWVPNSWLSHLLHSGVEHRSPPGLCAQPPPVHTHNPAIPDIERTLFQSRPTTPPSSNNYESSYQKETMWSHGKVNEQHATFRVILHFQLFACHLMASVFYEF